MRKSRLGVTLALLAALVALFVVSFVLGSQHSSEESFAGTDSVVTDMLATDHNVEPWFQPLFEPGSGEIESGLFALQAALGAGIVGYAFGNLRGRAAARSGTAATDEETAAP